MNESFALIQFQSTNQPPGKMSNPGVQFDFPTLPCPVRNFLDHVEENPALPIRQLLQPFQAWEGTLRAVFAQDPRNEIVQDNIVNLIDIYHDDNQKKACIRGRKLDIETKEERERCAKVLLILDNVY